MSAFPISTRLVELNTLFQQSPWDTSLDEEYITLLGAHLHIMAKTFYTTGGVLDILWEQNPSAFKMERTEYLNAIQFAACVSEFCDKDMPRDPTYLIEYSKEFPTCIELETPTNPFFNEWNQLYDHYYYLCKILTRACDHEEGELDYMRSVSSASVEY